MPRNRWIFHHASLRRVVDAGFFFLSPGGEDGEGPYEGFCGFSDVGGNGPGSPSSVSDMAMAMGLSNFVYRDMGYVRS